MSAMEEIVSPRAKKEHLKQLKKEKAHAGAAEQADWEVLNQSKKLRERDQHKQKARELEETQHQREEQHKKKPTVHHSSGQGSPSKKHSKPKPALSGFQIFCREHCHKSADQLKEDWKNLGADTKEAYVKRSNADKDRYKRELEAFHRLEQEMESLTLGHSHGAKEKKKKGGKRRHDSDSEEEEGKKGSEEDSA